MYLYSYSFFLLVQSIDIDPANVMRIYGNDVPGIILSNISDTKPINKATLAMFLTIFILFSASIFNQPYSIIYQPVLNHVFVQVFIFVLNPKRSKEKIIINDGMILHAIMYKNRYNCQLLCIPTV